MWQRWLLGTGAPFISLVDPTDSSKCHHMHNFDGCSQHKCWMAAVPFPFPLFHFRTLASLILCKVWSAKVFSVSTGWGVDGIHIDFWSNTLLLEPYAVHQHDDACKLELLWFTVAAVVNFHQTGYQEGVEADVILCSAAINACAVGSSWQEAFQILDLLSHWSLAVCSADSFCRWIVLIRVYAPTSCCIVIYSSLFFVLPGFWVHEYFWRLTLWLSWPGLSCQTASC